MIVFIGKPKFGEHSISGDFLILLHSGINLIDSAAEDRRLGFPRSRVFAFVRNVDLARSNEISLELAGMYFGACRIAGREIGLRHEFGNPSAWNRIQIRPDIAKSGVAVPQALIENAARDRNDAYYLYLWAMANITNLRRQVLSTEFRRTWFESNEIYVRTYAKLWDDYSESGPYAVDSTLCDQCLSTIAEDHNAFNSAMLFQLQTTAMIYDNRACDRCHYYGDGYGRRV